MMIIRRCTYGIKFSCFFYFISWNLCPGLGPLYLFIIFQFPCEQADKYHNNKTTLFEQNIKQ